MYTWIGIGLFLFGVSCVWMAWTNNKIMYGEWTIKQAIGGALLPKKVVRFFYFVIGIALIVFGMALALKLIEFRT